MSNRVTTTYNYDTSLVKRLASLSNHKFSETNLTNGHWDTEVDDQLKDIQCCQWTPSVFGNIK